MAAAEPFLGSWCLGQDPEREVMALGHGLRSQSPEWVWLYPKFLLSALTLGTSCELGSCWTLQREPQRKTAGLATPILSHTAYAHHKARRWHGLGEGLRRSPAKGAWQWAMALLG